MKKRFTFVVVVAAAIMALAAGTAKATVVAPPSVWCVNHTTVTLNFTGAWGEYDYADAEFYQAASTANHGFWFNPQGDVGEGESSFGTAADNPQSLYPGRDEILYLEDDAILYPEGTPTAPYVFYSVSAGACPVSAPPPSSMFVCYSTFEPDAGQVFTVPQGLAVLKDPSSVGWTQAWLPWAVKGAAPSANNPVVGSYYLTCQLPSGMKATGMYHGADGPGAMDSITSMDYKTAGTVEYPIAG